MRDADDLAIWTRAAADRAVIVTKDEDFTLLIGSSIDTPRVLWVRIGNVTNRALLARFEQVWPEIEAHLSTPTSVVELR